MSYISDASLGAIDDYFTQMFPSYSQGSFSRLLEGDISDGELNALLSEATSSCSGPEDGDSPGMVVACTAAALDGDPVLDESLFFVDAEAFDQQQQPSTESTATTRRVSCSPTDVTEVPVSEDAKQAAAAPDAAATVPTKKRPLEETAAPLSEVGSAACSSFTKDMLKKARRISFESSCGGGVATAPATGAPKQGPLKSILKKRAQRVAPKLSPTLAPLQPKPDNVGGGAPSQSSGGTISIVDALIKTLAKNRDTAAAAEVVAATTSPATPMIPEAAAAPMMPDIAASSPTALVVADQAAPPTSITIQDPLSKVLPPAQGSVVPDPTTVAVAACSEDKTAVVANNVLAVPDPVMAAALEDLNGGGGEATAELPSPPLKVDSPTKVMIAQPQTAAAAAASPSSPTPPTITSTNTMPLELEQEQEPQKPGRKHQRLRLLSKEEREKICRDRNRVHARNTRLRKKAYVEDLKKQILDMVQQRDAEDARKERQAKILKQNKDVRFMVMDSFLKLHAREESNEGRWATLLKEDVTMTMPYRSSEECCNTVATGVGQVMAGMQDLTKSLRETCDDPKLTIAFQSDRKSFLMDDNTAVAQITLITNTTTSNNNNKRSYSGSLRATFCVQTNKIQSAHLLMDFGTLFLQQQQQQQKG